MKAECQSQEENKIQYWFISDEEASSSSLGFLQSGAMLTEDSNYGPVMQHWGIVRVKNLYFQQAPQMILKHRAAY